MKQKLIHTDLLSKYKHSSVIGIATATHLEYCNFMYKMVRQEIANFEIFYKCLVDIVASVITLILIPLFLLTHGLIFYPYYIYKHIKFIRDVIKKYDIEKLNIKAKELAGKIERDHTENE